MSDHALCRSCRKPLNQDGICPRCAPDDARVAERLRQLRDEIRLEKGGDAPARPISRTWKRAQTRLEKAAKRAKEEAEEAEPETEGETPVDGEPSAPPVPAPDDDSTQVKPSEAAGESVTEEGVTPGPTRVWKGLSASGIRARELDVTDPRHGSDAVGELLEHKRKGLGKIVGLAGLPRHGKTKLADRLRERYAQRPGADLRYDKTERGEVNIYYVPGRREHHVLIDVAGEDFQALGDYERDLPALMRRFLWPVLQELDGLVLLMALPIVWAGWNEMAGAGDGADPPDRRADPAERDEIAMREARERMVNAHRMLLKYALVARDLDRLRKALPDLGLSPDEAPTRNQVDDAVPTARKLSAPVSVGFSKADLYVPAGLRAERVGGTRDGREGRDAEAGTDRDAQTEEPTRASRSGLYTPDVPGMSGQPAPPLHPVFTDPLVLGYLHFPELFEFLMDRVRYFHFDFVQALVDRSRTPNPQEARDASADAGRETLLGAEGLLEFVTQHPWWLPGLDTAMAIRLNRKLRPERWDRDLLRSLHDPGGVR